MQIQKAIEIFLEKNNLTKTLHNFKAQSKRNNSQFALCKSLQLSTIHKFTLNSTNAQDIRDFFQRTQAAPLKRAVNKFKRKQHLYNERVDLESLSRLPFFKKMMDKENENSQNNNEIDQSFSDLRQSRSVVFSLDQSRIVENEFLDPNESLFEFYECPASELGRVSEDLSKIKNFTSNTIKTVAYPSEYYQKHEIRITRVIQNHFDHKKSKLPAKVRFKREQNEKIYPLEYDGKTYDCYSLKVVYDREKTGLQQERQLPIVIDEVLAGRYQVIAVLGQAQFSIAIRVKDLTNNKYYCIKIIQNSKEESSKDYFDQSIDQIKLLRYISANCNPEQSHLLTLHDYFYHKQHLMLVTQLLKDSLLDAYKMHPKHFDFKAIQNYSRQILTALDKLHSLHIIHTDLKPENILLKSYTKQQAKVIDLGSSIFFHDRQDYCIQTISYRAPQVILGCSYDDKIDIWSFGCIIAQIFTGQVLFQGVTPSVLLAQMQALRGPWPSWMIQTGAEVKKYFTSDLVIHQQTVPEKRKKFNLNESETINRTKDQKLYKVYVPKMTNLKSKVPTDNKLFLDFIGKCLKLDPTVRLSARQALKHPFLNEKYDQ